MPDVDALELQITGDATSAKKSIDELIKSLNKLKQATSGGCGLSAVATGLKEVSKYNGKLNFSFKSANSFSKSSTKILASAFTLKKAGNLISSWIKESNDYIENANLFGVAMGEYANSAKQYADMVGEAMGVDPSDWMRNQALFMTLATGFGVASDRANTMSQQLTQLGYDISSFFNTSVEDAMTKLQSGLAGELEPLRRLGYDLSQAKLEATALSLGIDKAVSSMTQAEKAELRYYAIMTQVTTAQGDMARTLDAPANQLRVLKAQATQAARALGNLFIPVLNAILPYAIAVVKVLRLVVNTIASLFGITVGEVDFSQSSSSLGSLSDNASSADDSLNDAAGSAKKLKKTLLGIDELNVLPDNSGGGAGDIGGGGFDFELPTYNFLEGLSESRVATIVEEMKEWLGITGDIDSWAELFDTKLGKILIAVGAIGTAFAAWKLTQGFTSAIGIIQSIMANPVLSLAIGATLAITGFTLAFDGMGDAIENGLGGLNFAEIVGGSLLGTGGAALLASQLATWITTAFAGSAVDLAIVQAGINLGVGTVGAAGAALAAGISGIILGIPMFFVGIYDAIKNGLDWLSGILIPLGATAAGAGIGTIIGSLGGPIGAGAGALIGLVIGLLTDFGIWLWQNFDNIEAWFNGLPGWGKAVVVAIGLVAAAVAACTIPFTGLTAFLPVLIAGVIAFLKKWEDVKSFLSGIANWFYTNVVKPIVDFFAPILQAWYEIFSLAFTRAKEIVVGICTAMWSIVTKVTEIWLKIAEILVALGKAAYTYVIQPILEFVIGIASTIYEKAIKPVLDKIKIIATWVYDHIIAPILDKIYWLRDKAVELFKKIGTTMVEFISGSLKTVINGLLYLIENNINGFIRLLNSAIDIINKVPGVSITKVSLLSIPRLADGGMVSEGQMFVAREAGPELVGSVGRKTTVMNNDQIVDSVSRGVYQAVVAAMGSSNGDKVVEAKVNDKVLFEVMVSRARQETMRTGYNPLLGGV